MRYRLIKRTKASGFVTWVIQRKLAFFGWDYIDSFLNERNALETLHKLKTGIPPERTEVIE